MGKNVECFTPEEEEIEDAIYFMMNCNKPDLVDAWNRISSEWDLASVVKVHNFLSQTYRMSDLLDAISSNDNQPMQS